MPIQGVPSPLASMALFQLFSWPMEVMAMPEPPVSTLVLTVVSSTVNRSVSIRPSLYRPENQDSHARYSSEVWPRDTLPSFTVNM